MIQCQTCKHVWPEESTFCGQCGRSMGLRICEKGHENPLGVHRCLTCGSCRLSEGTECLGFGCLFGAAGWIGGLFALLILGPIILHFLVSLVVGFFAALMPLFVFALAVQIALGDRVNIMRPLVSLLGSGGRLLLDGVGFGLKVLVGSTDGQRE